jgi:hypothetical protein
VVGAEEGIANRLVLGHGDEPAVKERLLDLGRFRCEAEDVWDTGSNPGRIYPLTDRKAEGRR